MKISATTLFLAIAFPLLAFAEEEMEEKPLPAAEMAVPAKTQAPAIQPDAMPKSLPAGERPKDLDLRHCLDLGDNVAIARCAYE